MVLTNKHMTIAQQLNITDFPFTINNAADKEIYYEDSTGYWFKKEYNGNGNVARWEDSTGYWAKWEYNANGNVARREDSTGYWLKCEYDADVNLVYMETQDGIKLDNRPKTEITLDEITNKFGIPVSQLKIKK